MLTKADKSYFRSLFSHHQNGHIYLNHASISPLPNQTSDAIRDFLNDRQQKSVENFEAGMDIMEQCRNRIATLIHTQHEDHITFMGNTSDGISAVAEGVAWEAGDEIILNSMEFPSNIQPFRAIEKKGLTLTYLSPNNGMITPEMIKNAITPKTKMVSISAVQYLNGFNADLKSIGEICKANNIWFVVDGIQALGTMDIDVTTCHIDALATGGHKWLMSPMGIGFLYLSPDFASSLLPAKTGWLSVEEPWQLSTFQQEWKPINQHLETGTPNMFGITGLHSSLDMFLTIGTQTIRAELLNLTDAILTRLQKHHDVSVVTPLAPANRSGIVTFKWHTNKKIDTIINHLKKKHITISSREGLIRLSPHFYNTTEEIYKAIDQVFDS